jgi:glycosyltransferase 2 family protein
LKKTITRASRIIFFLAIGAFFIILAFRDIPLADLVSGIRSARYEWVLLSLACATLAFISRAARWVLLIEPLGYRPPVLNTFYAVMTGYLANFILPRIGEVTRCASLSRTDRIPVGLLLGTVITERMADLIVLLLLTASVIFMQSGLFGNFIYSYIAGPFISWITSLAGTNPLTVVIIISIFIIPVLLYRPLKTRLKKQEFFGRIEKAMKRIGDGMKSVLKLQKKTQFIFHTVFIWLMYLFMTMSIFMALPATARLNIADALFIMVAGGLGMAAPVQGGIGTYHWIVAVALGLYGIPREDGLVFATLSHESQALLMIFLGSLSMLMVFNKWKKAES